MNWISIISGVFLLTAGVAGNFSENEFELIKILCKFFNVRYLLFVDDESTFFEMTKAVKMSSGEGIPSMALTSNYLKQEVIKWENSFFSERRTMIAVKGKIELAFYLNLIENPWKVVWSLFEDPADVVSVGVQIPIRGRIMRIKRESDELVVQELLKSKTGEAPLQRHFGRFKSKSEAEFVSRGWEFYKQKINVTNLVLKVGISHEICRSRKDGVLLELIFCSHSQILELMVQQLDIRIEYITYPETRYSFVYPNGSYSGYFRMMLDNEVNMSVAGFVVTRKRLQDFDFIWPTFALNTMMYLKKADIVKASLANSPFTNGVWLIISILILSTGNILFFSDHSSGKSNTGSKWRKIGESIMKILQLICNQGSSDDPLFSSGRIIHCTSLFAGMLLYYYYSAVVLSFLAVESIDLPFTDIEGFIENKKYKIIAPAGGFVSYYVAFELTQFRQQSHQYLIPSDLLPASIDECVNQLCKKKWLTLLALEGSLLNIKGAECELSAIPTSVFTQFFGFALVKGFPYSEYFQLVLWKLKEIGVLVRMQRNLTMYNLKGLHVDSGYNTVAIEQIINILMILLFGVILSIIVLILELIQYRRQKKITYLKRLRDTNVKRILQPSAKTVHYFHTIPGLIRDTNFLGSRINQNRFEAK